MSNNRINVKYKKHTIYNWGRVKKWWKKFSNKSVRRRQDRATQREFRKVPFRDGAD